MMFRQLAVIIAAGTLVLAALYLMLLAAGGAFAHWGGSEDDISLVSIP